MQFDSAALLINGAGSLFPLVYTLVPCFFGELIFIQGIFHVGMTVLFILSGGFVDQQIFVFTVYFVFSTFASVPFVSPGGSVSMFITSMAGSVDRGV